MEKFQAFKRSASGAANLRESNDLPYRYMARCDAIHRAFFFFNILSLLEIEGIFAEPQSKRL